MRRRDWIGLLEAAYDLSGDIDAWIARLLDAAAPVLDSGHGVAAQLFRLRSVGVTVERSAHRGVQPAAALAEATIAAASPEALDLVYRSGIPAATMSEVMWSRFPAQGKVFAATTEGAFRDAIGIVAYSGTGGGLALNSPLAEPRTMTAAERRRWTQVCAHVGAGQCLRQQCAARRLGARSRTSSARSSRSWASTRARSWPPRWRAGWTTRASC